MKGYNKWSYTPYRPYFFEVGNIYICRIAPTETAIHVEWLIDESSAEHSVFFKKRADADYTLAGKTDGCEFDITNLETECDYEFYVASGEKKSRVRLARTGNSVGVTVNYLHPDDAAYSFSGQYLCSPSMVRHPDGYLLVSMDLFKGGAPQNLTLIFRSDDEGESWHYVSELMPCFWGKMFIHKGELYMLSVSTEYGDLLIGKSTDGGASFTAPVTLLRGSNGKAGGVGVHKNPQNVFVHNGRLYNTLEWGSWSAKYHAAMVMSCDVNSDLLDPESWEFTDPVKYDPTWAGVATGESSGNIEGTLTLAPDGRLLNVMRYDMTKTKEKYGLVLAYEVNANDPSAPLTYSHSIKFPANHSKFTIKQDPLTKKYYSLATRITNAEFNYDRRLLSLMVSNDLDRWSVVINVLDYREFAGPQEVGFQYVDFEIEGDDIIFACRTAINHAHNFHDSNYITFHRIKNFRSI
ncbi:MAG: exo-alpha-sialidase [Clostridia bacterium]|nr:exo-alpha-sialidase [Clostridia bacterium]